MNVNLQHSSDLGKAPSLINQLSSQEEFEQIMEAELPVFYEVILEALDRTKKDLSGRPLSYQNRNTRSGRMNENIKGLLFDHFPDQMHENRNRRFYFEKDKKYVIYF